MSDQTLALDRAKATLLGLAMGDAMGMPAQTLGRAEIALRYGRIASFVAPFDGHPVSHGLQAGQVTDDTEQSLLLARRLISDPDGFDDRAWAQDLLDWESDIRARGLRDLLGPSSKAALDALLAGASPDETGRRGTTNGAAMRIAPVGVMTPPEPALIVARVARACRVTHNTGEAIAAASAVAMVVSMGVAGHDFEASLDAALQAARQGQAQGHCVGASDIATRIAHALDLGARGDVEAICVGEPWASFTVEREVGALLLPGTAIWAAPPEKGLVLRRAFTEDQAELTGRLMRALWRAGQWLDEPDNRGTAAEILSRREYLNLPSELTERGLAGRLMVTPAGEMRDCPDFITFNRGAATFPWKSLAALFADRIIRRHGLDPEPAMRAAMGCYRTDLYRQHLRPAGAPLPGASMRVEGMIDSPRRVAAERGQMILGADAFFDGRIYEPPFTS